MQSVVNLSTREHTMTHQELREELEHLEQTRDKCEAFIRGYQEGLRQIQFKIDALNEALERAQA